MKNYLFISSLLLLSLLFCLPALADGIDVRDPEVPRVPNPTVEELPAGNVPAENIDERLPPVIPGQRVTAGGSKHKVISTSGPVPVSPVPEIQQPRANGVSAVDFGSVGVIVDRDKD